MVARRSAAAYSACSVRTQMAEASTSSFASLLANAADTKADFDFSKLNKSYWEGRDQYAKNELRDAFRNGVPTDDNGQPDFGAMAKVLFQKGGLEQGVAASNLDVSRQQLKAGQELAAKLGTLEGGGQPAQPKIVSPPSANRTATAAVAPPLARGGAQPSGQAPQAAAAPQGGTTIMGILSAQGIPNDQLDAASASIARQIGVDDPNAPIDVNNPQIRNVLVPAIQQLKRMGLGQVVQQQAQTGQAVPQQPQAPATAQVAPNPQQNQGTFGAPSAVATRGAIPTGTDPEIQKQIAIYTSVASNPAYPKSVQEAALTRLKALQDQGAPTPDIKNYELYRRQGGNLPFNEWMADTERRKTAATEEAKSIIKKYEGLVEAGTKAQMEIPQLDLLKEQMNDPNFFSGAGEKYNLLYKRLKSAVGIDPEAAVPQEYLRKATAANVLSSLGALKGLGQIRVAEINMAREAAASPDNSIPANKLLVEISKRTHERNAQIAEMAQDYKERTASSIPASTSR
ncbi:hypothetical protein IVB34_12770 [Bradyrhizobium sp. 2]|uniref:hypothetical protein n=1 Tax=Bradyrhizobium sp. 2 TaxID=190045 RepID=UPI001FFBFCA1|nr:hypothetical protein [Bradyrhizobium sp. 2]MCK1459228.1 hypothetical protein [Bradyrhizobium sp. 2]